MAGPVVTFDLDGVLCRPPFGINPGNGRGKRRDSPGTKGLLWRTERWRYLGRGPMPGVRDGFAEARTLAACHVVTARAEVARDLTERWLARHVGDVPPLEMRPHWRETSAAFKVRRLRELGAVAHFEDDPHTALWLAGEGLAVFLVDWPRNRWVEHPRVTRIARIREALPALAGLLRAVVGQAGAPSPTAAGEGNPGP